nr:MAG TPA: hypothetical protein [Caudoviricetes sp.]
MALLKTNYKDDILLDNSGKRKYTMITNDDGTVSFVDVTDYSQNGDAFGAADINATNTEVNEHFASVEKSLEALNTKISTSTFGSQVTLTKNEEYICPADGYLRITCAYNKSSVARGYVNGAELLTLSSTNSDTVTPDNTTSASVFVRAGMTVKYAGTNAKGYYRPISTK